MELLIAPARAFDFAEALDDAGTVPIRLTRGNFGLFARQVDAGGAMTIRTAGGALVMIAGLYPAGDWAEAWWAVGPAMRANLWRALAIARRLLEEIGTDAAPLDVRAHVPADSVAGAHVARLFRFHLAGTERAPPFGDLAVWRRVF